LHVSSHTLSLISIKSSNSFTDPFWKEDLHVGLTESCCQR
jgi:hypothetical protein